MLACGSLPAIGEKDFTLTVFQGSGPQDPFLSCIMEDLIDYGAREDNI